MRFPDGLRPQWLMAVVVVAVAASVGAGLLWTHRPPPVDPCLVGRSAIHDLTDWAIAGEFDDEAWIVHSDRIDAIHPGWGQFLKKAPTDPFGTRSHVTKMLISLVDDCAPPPPQETS